MDDKEDPKAPKTLTAEAIERLQAQQRVSPDLQEKTAAAAGVMLQGLYDGAPEELQRAVTFTLAGGAKATYRVEARLEIEGLPALVGIVEGNISAMPDKERGVFSLEVPPALPSPDETKH